MYPLLASFPDRLRHVLVVGKTGMGKSTLLREIAASDLQAGRGLLVVDPHGDLAREIGELVPRWRKNDLLRFDPTDPACPGLNPLRQVAGERRAQVVSGIVASAKKLWRNSWGARTEHVLRMALLALTEIRGATLLDAQRMLVEDKHRNWVLKQVKDPVVYWFWTREFPGYGPRLGPEVTSPILNKVGSWVAIPAVRTVLTKNRPRLDVSKALAGARVVIARLPKGELGEDGSYLLGGLLLGAFEEAVLARAGLPAAERRPFSILVDEVGSFATQPFIELMAEARKFGVAVTVAAQSLSAMDPELRAGLLGNAGTLVAFRVGGEDAEILRKEFADRFGPKTLTSLDVGECAVRQGGRDAVVFGAAA